MPMSNQPRSQDDFSTATSAFFSRGRVKKPAASAKVRSMRSWLTPWPAR